MDTFGSGDKVIHSDNLKEAVDIVKSLEAAHKRNSATAMYESIKHGHEFGDNNQCACGTYERDYLALPRVDRSLCPTYVAAKVETLREKEKPVSMQEFIQHGHVFNSSDKCGMCGMDLATYNSRYRKGYHLDMCPSYVDASKKIDDLVASAHLHGHSFNELGIRSTVTVPNVNNVLGLTIPNGWQITMLEDNEKGTEYSCEARLKYKSSTPPKYVRGVAATLDKALATAIEHARNTEISRSGEEQPDNTLNELNALLPLHATIRIVKETDGLVIDLAHHGKGICIGVTTYEMQGRTPRTSLIKEIIKSLRALDQYKTR